MALVQNPGYRASRGAWEEYLLNSTSKNFHVNENPHYASITHPGFNYTDLDRIGHHQITSIMQLTKDTFSLVVHPFYMRNGIKSSFMAWKELFLDQRIFLASSKYEISRTMYNASIRKWPLDAKVSYGGIGSTSLVVMFQLFLPGTAEPLVTRYASVVSVDFNTRKPVPFPEWYKKELKGREAKIPANVRVNRFQRPPNTFSERLKVTFVLGLKRAWIRQFASIKMSLN